jgi:ketosteroid isomerase-like protein
MPSLEMMRNYLDHITGGEFDTAIDYWADDIVVHVSGNSVLSGTYVGKEASSGYLANVLGLVDSVMVEEHDLLVSDHHAVVLSTVRADRGGQHMEGNRIVIYHVEGELIIELWIIDEDQKSVSEFWS